ncbi:MAG: LLM class flavin-dependent oxidoreductase, partial [Pseudomonadota bacterium]|nr:LLM class flavin-dependent oxidoreductase [Pseudomonadota bacterium]
RVIFGIGSGGLSSDWEVFNNLDHAKRGRAMLESIDVILRLWAEGPPFEHAGENWQFAMKDYVIDDLGVGHMIKPLQQPHPPVAVSIRGRNSGLAMLAGERGWIPISGNFIDADDIACHWPRYQEGADSAERAADPSIWRVARSVLVTDSDSEADDILADPEGVFSDYYYYLNTHMKLASGTLTQPHDPAAERAEAVKKAKSLVIAGSRRRVLDQLIAFCEQVGDFGHLVITGHDMDGRHEMWRRSFTAIAEEIAPRLTQHREGRRRVA